MTGADLIVAQWPRNGRETIIVKLGEYQGNAIVDVRTWFDGGDGLKPGRSGITLAVRHLPVLADAMAKALTMALASGTLTSATVTTGDASQDE